MLTAALLGEVFRSWRANRTIREGACLAYSGLFALVPLLVLSVVLARLLFTGRQVRAFLTAQLDLLGDDAGRVAGALTGEVEASAGTLGAVGLVSLLFAASLLFVALQDALDTIWHVPFQPCRSATASGSSAPAPAPEDSCCGPRRSAVPSPTLRARGERGGPRGGRRVRSR